MNKVPTLTEREREVVVYVACGLMCSEIAIRMGISPRTVEVHKTNINEKIRNLGNSEFSIVVLITNYAVKNGFVCDYFDPPFIPCRSMDLPQITPCLV
jgi:DNA-binding CsgD family transcriptional regulator